MKKFMTFFAKILQLLVAATMLGYLIIGAFRIGMILSQKEATFAIGTVPSAPVALILGAGLLADGTPSAVLQDRIDIAIDLYQAGKVKKLLMSGDNSTIFYNEPGAMKTYALSKGIPEEDIVLDYAGRRTYDSCYRLKSIFGVDEAIIITQNYHLSRALFLCRNLGVTAYGVSSDLTFYLRHRYVIWRVREVAATLGAYWDIYFRHPTPILGKYEPIFPEH